jgi:hypothetical protein
MAGNWKQMAGAVSLLAFLTSTSAAVSQEGRPWVDPPSDSVAPTKTPPAPVPSPAPPQANVPAAPPEAIKESAQVQRPSEAQEKASTETVRSNRKVAAERKPRKGSAKVVASTKPSASAGTRKQTALERRSRNNVRSAKVRDAVNSGLEVMSLRTIEFPDGRRIEVLVRPSPGTVSRLMNEPY